MKNFYTFLLLLVLSINAIGQTPVMTLTSSKAVGSTISLKLISKTNNTPVQIDFGDGVPKTYTINSSTTVIEEILKGSKIINIYGNGIVVLSCAYCNLTEIDVSKNPELEQLVCYENQLTSLDVSKNTALDWLDCSGNKLSSLDVTQNTSLTVLRCSGNKLTTLDVSKIIYLIILYCGDNKLASLDVSKCLNLEALFCDNNLLTSIDISKNTKIESLGCEKNKLSFATLPLKQAGWSSYVYAPQQPISINKNLSADAVIDLSGQFSINGTISGYIWKTKGGKTLVNGTDYSLSGGKTTFLKGQSDSVYCEITNATFPDFTGDKVLKTTCVGFSKISMSTSKAVGSKISFDLSVTTANTSILVDFGDGNPVPCTIDKSHLISGTLVKSQTVHIYATGFNSFSCRGSQLTILDVSNAVGLVSLLCDDNQLTALDVSKNTKLGVIYCGRNQLATLNVKNNTALYNLQCEDNQLSELDVTKNLKLNLLVCENNRINALDLSQHTLLTSIYCRNNKIKILDVSKNTALDNLQCGNNELTALDVSNNTKLGIFYCNDNQLTTLKISNNAPFNSGFVCSYNQLNFSTIPIPKASWPNYYYDNQKPVAIVKSLAYGAMLDLSSQLTINGNTTIYKWRTKGGTTLAEGTDYTLTGGKTVFLKGQNDSVYCEMTNATFPAFTAGTPLKTTYTKILKDVQTITFSELPAKKANDTPFNVSASASSGLPVTFVSSDPSAASINGATVTILKGGSVTITATQVGDDTWETVSASQTLNISKVDQTITFETLPEKKANDAPFELTATASSSLQVAYTSSDPSVASITGNTVTILKAGTINITAAQSGNNSWNPAQSITQALSITPVTAIGRGKDDLFTVYPNPSADMLYFKGNGSDNMRVSIYNLLGTKVWIGIVNDKKVDISQLPAGVYILKMSSNKETQTIRFVKQ
jgi:Leucine-rich repeat (LRR) protein